jgi:hypothetical protein
LSLLSIRILLITVKVSWPHDVTLQTQDTGNLILGTRILVAFPEDLLASHAPVHGIELTDLSPNSSNKSFLTSAYIQISKKKYENFADEKHFDQN